MSTSTTRGALSALTVQGLIPDTTYWFKAGSLWSGATTYAAAVSSVTYTNLLSPSVLSVSSLTVTAGWPAFAVGSGTTTAQGYRLEAYSDAGYTSLAGSSVTTSVSVSTLTISSLSPYTTYYLRAGAVNWNSVVNYITFGSTMTSAGLAPTSVQVLSVYITTAAVGWVQVAGSGGYELDASSTNFVGGVVMSSVTPSVALSTLTVQGLIPDTTYWFKAGSLWNGATTYASAVSSVTYTNFLSPSVLRVSSLTVTAGWPAFSVGSGTTTAQGYRLE